MIATPALFLDRDGVVNIDHGYSGNSDGFTFMPGIFELTRRAEDLGFRIVIVTNQSGIGRGYYGVADFLVLSRWIAARLAAMGGVPTATLFCPFHPTAGHGPWLRDSFWRKPNPGMILEATSHFGLDLAGSVMIGDQLSDIAAARQAGIGHRVLLRPSADTDAGAEADGGTVKLSGDERVVGHLGEVLPILDVLRDQWLTRVAAVTKG